jgi:hypothetical protein
MRSGVFGSIPQLAPALSFQRSSNNPIVLAFQSFSQLPIEVRKEILSNAYTRILLGMADPEECEYASKLLGLPTELERIRESQSAHWWESAQKKRRDYQSERLLLPQVIPGEVQNRENGCGYLAQAGRITPIEVAYRAPKRRVPGVIPYVWPTYERPPKRAPKPVPEKKRQPGTGARSYVPVAQLKQALE